MQTAKSIFDVNSVFEEDDIKSNCARYVLSLAIKRAGDNELITDAITSIDERELRKELPCDIDPSELKNSVKRTLEEYLNV